MARFKYEEYDGRDSYDCPECGANENAAECVEAHSWQDLGDEYGEDGEHRHSVLAEGEDLEMRCGECSAIYWVPGQIQRTDGPRLERSTARRDHHRPEQETDKCLESRM